MQDITLLVKHLRGCWMLIVDWNQRPQELAATGLPAFLKGTIITVAGGGNASTSLSGAPRAATACEQRARGGSVPAQSSRSIGFLMLVGSSLTFVV